MWFDVSMHACCDLQSALRFLPHLQLHRSVSLACSSLQRAYTPKLFARIQQSVDPHVATLEVISVTLVCVTCMVTAAASSAVRPRPSDMHAWETLRVAVVSVQPRLQAMLSSWHTCSFVVLTRAAFPGTCRWLRVVVEFHDSLCSVFHARWRVLSFVVLVSRESGLKSHGMTASTVE